MIPEHVRRYLLAGLEATPIALDRLLKDAPEAAWDLRPDPERFTLREVMAHLADWEPVWRERLERIRSEDLPELPGYDEGQWAIDHDYAHADPRTQQALFRDRRAQLLEMLRALSPDDWQRAGQHSQWGRLTMCDLATLILGHDGYHLRQTAEWLEAAGRDARTE